MWIALFRQKWCERNFEHFRGGVAVTLHNAPPARHVADIDRFQLQQIRSQFVKGSRIQGHLFKLYI